MNREDARCPADGHGEDATCSGTPAHPWPAVTLRPVDATIRSAVADGLAAAQAARPLSDSG